MLKHLRIRDCLFYQVKAMEFDGNEVLMENADCDIFLGRSQKKIKSYALISYIRFQSKEAP